MTASCLRSLQPWTLGPYDLDSVDALLARAWRPEFHKHERRHSAACIMSAAAAKRPRRVTGSPRQGNLPLLRDLKGTPVRA